jgi:hypothetical protein
MLKTIVPLLTVAYFTTGCGIFDVEVKDQKAKAKFNVISATSKTWEGIVAVRPNDLEKVREHKDDIKDATINAVRLSVILARGGNQAALGDVTGWARPIGGDFPAEPDFTLKGFRLAEGSAPTPDNSKPNNANEEIPIDQEKLNRVKDLMFPKDGGVNDIEVKVIVAGDGLPDLQFEVTVEFDAVANPF